LFEHYWRYFLRTLKALARVNEQALNNKFLYAKEEYQPLAGE
jgi:hypothetical protein